MLPPWGRLLCRLQLRSVWHAADAQPVQQAHRLGRSDTRSAGSPRQPRQRRFLVQPPAASRDPGRAGSAHPCSAAVLERHGHVRHSSVIDRTPGILWRRLVLGTSIPGADHAAPGIGAAVRRPRRRRASRRRVRRHGRPRRADPGDQPGSPPVLLRAELCAHVLGGRSVGLLQAVPIDRPSVRVGPCRRNGRAAGSAALQSYSQRPVHLLSLRPGGSGTVEAMGAPLPGLLFS